MDKKFSHKLIEYRGKKYIVLGWREWVILPELGVSSIKAKIDTGARTSSLHAFGIERFSQQGRDKVRFDIHPIQRNDKTVVKCVSDLIDVRMVTDSGAHRELRYVIETPMIIGDFSRSIEITLTNRSSMIYRMLLGRKALQQHFIIDPTRSFHT
ncbi:MAG: ATP-dependent zinc protease [Gammaproteobacteria bacterium]|nr:ATP-dependent zinc protease [Gammaproteobacteria bacterium]